ncbi:hypothetical protein J6W78_06950 [bacterium]|nr:hypothetical protein [bacterium]
MKKFLTITLLVVSMMIFVSCGESDDETDTGDTVSDSDSGSDTGDSATDEEKTDTGDQTNDEENNTPGLPDDDDGDSTNDEEATDTGDQTNDDDDTDTDTDTGDHNIIDDSNCTTVVYKSMDVRKMDVNEIDIWLYDSETYEDYTDPLFFVEAHFAKNVEELKGETVSLKGSDPNKEDGDRVFFFVDLDSSMMHFREIYIAKSGSFHIEDVDAEDYTKLKVNTTAIVFYELLIDEENGVYTEVQNGKCYKLEPFEWNTID